MASFRKRKSGRWQAQVRKKGYPTQTKSFRCKAAAAQWVRSIEYEMDQGLFMPRNEAETTTVADQLRQYLKECTPHKRGACLQQLPIPSYRVGSQKSPWLISAADLANHIDQQRPSAANRWTSVS